MEDNSALIWDGAWQAPEIVLRGHGDAVNSVAWSPDGAELVTAGMDGTARVWDAKSGEERLRLEGHEGRVSLALWAPGGELLATGGDDGTVRLWGAGDGRQVRMLEPEGESVSTLAWSPDGQRLVSGHDDGRLAFWDVSSGELLEVVAGHVGPVSDLAWSPVDDRLASADNSGFARIWRAGASTAWRTLPTAHAQGLDWTGDGRFLAVAGGDIIENAEPPTFFIWDRVTDEIVVEDLAGELDYDSGSLLFFSPDDQVILFQGTPGFPDFSGFQRVFALDPWSGSFLQTFSADEGNLLWSFNWSPDGRQVATGTLDDPEIWIWDYERGEVVQKLGYDGAESGFQDVAWSPDGTKLAAALAEPGLAPVWDAHTWELLYTIDGHEPPAEVWSVEWSPDGSKVLTTAGSQELGASDNSARIWDGDSGEEVLALRGHTASVLMGNWSPDGGRIVTSSLDNTVRVWDATSGAELLRLTQPPIVVAAAWSPDGDYLATSGMGPATSVWRVWQSKEELVAFARECCVFRALTAGERQRFALTGR